MRKTFFANITLLMIFVFSLVLGYQNIQANPAASALAVPTVALPQIPTYTPGPFATISPNTIPHWLTYTNSQYHFHFSYPDNLTSFGGISGSMTGNPIDVFNLGDERTARGFSDAPFDGLNVYVVPNPTGMVFNTYLAQEKKQLIYIGKLWQNPNTEETRSQAIVVGPNGQLWTHLIGCFLDGNARYYTIFPDGKHFLVVSRGSSTPGFPEVFDYILSTFKFDR